MHTPTLARTRCIRWGFFIKISKSGLIFELFDKIDFALSLAKTSGIISINWHSRSSLCVSSKAYIIGKKETNLKGEVFYTLFMPNFGSRWCFLLRESAFFVMVLPQLFVFSINKYITTLSPGFLGQRFNNLQRAALLMSFWRHGFNNFRRAALLTSLIRYGEGSFQIWWTAAGHGKLCMWF